MASAIDGPPGNTAKPELAVKPEPVPVERELAPVGRDVPMISKTKEASLPINGDVGKFLIDCVTAAKGSRVSWVELYVHYHKWCADKNLTPLEASIFGRRLDDCREEGTIRSRRTGDNVYCLDVKLAARRGHDND
jgi:hypothetical protein